jgi:hypothetical protein
LNPSPKTFGINALRRRGWTKASIEHLLGVADFVVPNQQFPGCADTRPYSCGRVEEAERTPTFLKVLDRRSRRKL